MVEAIFMGPLHFLVVWRRRLFLVHRVASVVTRTITISNIIILFSMSVLSLVVDCATLFILFCLSFNTSSSALFSLDYGMLFVSQGRSM